MLAAAMSLQRRKVVKLVFIEVTLEEILGGGKPCRYLVGDCSGRQRRQCKGPDAEVGLPGMFEGQQRRPVCLE